MTGVTKRWDLATHSRVKNDMWRWRQIRVMIIQTKECKILPANHRELREAGTDHSLTLSQGAQPCRHLDLGPLFSRTMRQYISLFKPLSVWYFVIAEQANKNSLHTPSHKTKRQRTNHHLRLLPPFHSPIQFLNKFNQFWMLNHSWVYSFFIINSTAMTLVQGLLPLSVFL